MNREKQGMTAATKRMGRPTKPARKGRRYQIGVIVTGETKAVIDAAAKASGRTISREVEHLIERALGFEHMFESMRTTLAQIESGSITSALRRKGYTPVRTPHGEAWLPPTYPIEKSGFISPEEDQST
jgi:hypothetical protein